MGVSAKKRAGKYLITWKNEAGKWRTCAGFRDKRASQARFEELQTRADRLRLGLPVENAVAARLFSESAQAYQADLKRRGKSTHCFQRAAKMLCTIADHCRWKNLHDIKPDGLTAYLAHLADSSAPSTINFYRDLLSRFCKWCISQGWLAENPVAGVARSSQGSPGDIRFRPCARRPFTVHEFQQLTSCPKIRAWRRDLYTVAGLSGLRANELNQITPEDFTLGSRPRWHLRAGITKAKRLDVIPMLPECAEVLARLAAGLGPTDRLFPQRPSRHTVSADIRAAGIPRKDHRGRIVTFHSLRYFTCALLARHLPIQTVKVLMRHATLKMTADLYLDLGLDDIAEQMQSLPPLFRHEQLRADNQEKAG